MLKLAKVLSVKILYKLV